MKHLPKPDEPCKMERYVDNEGKFAFKWVYPEESEVKFVETVPVVAHVEEKPQPESKKKKK